MAATAATLIATGKPDLYRGAVYVGTDTYQMEKGVRAFVAEYVDFSDSKIPMLKTLDEIFAEAKTQVGPAHFCGEDGVIAMPHPGRPDILIVGTSQVRATDLDGAVIGPYLDYDQRKELEDRMFSTGQFEVGRVATQGMNAEHEKGLPKAPTQAQIDAEWARRKEVSRITGEAVDAAFRGIAATLNTDEGSPYSYAMNVESFRSIRNALRLEIAEKVNEASTHHHWSAQVKASNTTAESGCSICECGNKYWEFDTCTDCGTVHNPKNHS